MVTTVDLDRSFRVHQPIKMRGREWGSWGDCHAKSLIHVGFQVRFHLKKGFSGKTKQNKEKQPTTTKPPQNNNNKKLSKLKLKIFSGNDILYSLCFLFPKFNSGFFIGHTLTGLSLFQCLKRHE